MNSLHNHTGKRLIYLDFLRICSTFLVLFNHTYKQGYSLCVDTVGDTLFPFYLLCSAFCKIAVPVFLMISGALLLKKDEQISVVLKKRVPRFLVILIATSFVFYLYQLNHNYGEFSLLDFAADVYSKSIVTPLWYLYAFLAYLLTLPFLRRISRNAEKADYLYLTALMMLIAALKTVELLAFNDKLHFNSRFELFTISQIVYYPLMGDFIANKLPNRALTGKNVLRITLVGIMALVANCLLTIRWCAVIGEWNYNTFEQHIARFTFLAALQYL